MNINKGRVKKLALIYGIITLIVMIILCLFCPMGDGSDNAITQIIKDKNKLSKIDFNNKYSQNINSFDLKDGLVIGVCQDSHSSWWGGNIVLFLPDNKILTYKGHVCGNGYLNMIVLPLNNKDVSIAEFVKIIQSQIKLKSAQQGDAPETSAIKNPTPCSVATLLPPRLGVFNSTGPGDL